LHNYCQFSAVAISNKKCKINPPFTLLWFSPITSKINATFEEARTCYQIFQFLKNYWTKMFEKTLLKLKRQQKHFVSLSVVRFVDSRMSLD